MVPTFHDDCRKYTELFSKTKQQKNSNPVIIMNLLEGTRSAETTEKFLESRAVIPAPTIPVALGIVAVLNRFGDNSPWVPCSASGISVLEKQWKFFISQGEREEGLCFPFLGQHVTSSDSPV